MQKQPGQEVTALLREWAAGDRGALERLMPLVYEELRRLAASQLRAERPNHTLQPTALVHEAYMANVSPAFDGIRDDPRFKALVARLKLPN